MLSCFVHKDNKDIFTNAADLPGGKTRETARKDKFEALVEARASAKVNRPVTYGDVEYQMKKARVEGMASQIDRNKIANINEQIKMMRDQEEMFVSAYGEDTFIDNNIDRKTPKKPQKERPKGRNQLKKNFWGR